MMKNQILTPQQIYEIDTITLEEKIEQIQNHAYKQYFQQVLSLALIELQQRQKIQQWGRNLMNDVQLEIKTPQQQLYKPTKSLRNIGKQKQNKQKLLIFEKLKTTLVHQTYVIGRPAIKHTTIISHRKTLQQSNDKKNKRVPQKNIVKKPSIIAITKTQDIKMNKIIKNEMIENSNTTKTEVIMPKKQSKAKLTFKENDVYDLQELIIPKQKLSMIPIQQQSIIQQQIIREKLLTEHNQQNKMTIPQQIEYEQIKQQEIREQNQRKLRIQNIFKQQQQVKIEQSQRQKPIQQKQEHLQQQQKQYDHEKHAHTIQQPTIKQQQTNIINQVLNEQKYAEVTDKQQYTQQNHSVISKHSTNYTQKQSKSKSMKVVNKIPIRQTANKFHKPNDSKCDVQILTANLLDNQKCIQKKMRQTARSGTCFIRQSSTKNQLEQINTYPYHQIISSFNKLFPNSKALITTLRNVQNNLQEHFKKKVQFIAKNDEYMRINSDQLTFKVVSETDKVRKYGSYAGLYLNQYYARSDIMLKRIQKQVNTKNQDMLLYRVVRTKQDVYDIISSGFHRTQEWFQLPHGMQLKSSWNLLWTWSRPQIDFTDLFYFQKVNHFLGNRQIARKDLLKKNIEKIKKLGNKAKATFDIIPQTYFLPGENIAFVKKFREYQMKGFQNIWILKPVGLSRGRGIQVVKSLDEIVFSEPVVLQRYLSNPLLLKGYKFDMRIYVLVTSINPLEAYIYDEGFARISTERYSKDMDSLDNKFMHLTNFSIQKQNVSEQKSTTIEEKIGGCKISLKMLRQKLKDINVQWSLIEKQIQDITIKSLVAVMNEIPQNNNCFELFGYDIIIDEKLQCWLLEVNSSPSLEKDFILDQIIKQQLIDDTIRLVNPINYDRKRMLEVVQRRRKEAEGLKSHINTHNNSINQLNQDLHYILHGKPLHKYGEVNSNEYNYKRIAPSEKYFSIIKTLQQYKKQPIIKNST